MTERELMSLIYIQARISRISDRLAELEEENGALRRELDELKNAR